MRRFNPAGRPLAPSPRRRIQRGQSAWRLRTPLIHRFSSGDQLTHRASVSALVARASLEISRTVSWRGSVKGHHSPGTLSNDSSLDELIGKTTEIEAQTAPLLRRETGQISHFQQMAEKFGGWQRRFTIPPVPPNVTRKIDRKIMFHCRTFCVTAAGISIAGTFHGGCIPPFLRIRSTISEAKKKNAATRMMVAPEVRLKT